MPTRLSAVFALLFRRACSTLAQSPPVAFADDFVEKLRAPHAGPQPQDLSELSLPFPIFPIVVSPSSPCARPSVRSLRRLGSITCVERSVPPPGMTSFASWLKWLPSSSRAERRRRFDPGFAVPPCWPFRQMQWIPSSDGHRGALSRQLRFILWTGAHATFSSPRRAHA